MLWVPEYYSSFQRVANSPARVVSGAGVIQKVCACQERVQAPGQESAAFLSAGRAGGRVMFGGMPPASDVVFFTSTEATPPSPEARGLPL